MLNVVRRLLDRYRAFLAVVMVVIAGFEVLLCAIVASVNVEAAISQIMVLAPPLLRALIEQNVPGGTPAAVLAFGWNHPVAHALLTAVAITLAARAIAGEIENGAIELVLAQPLSRVQYLGAHVVFGLVAIAAVVAAGLAGTVIGQGYFGLASFAPGRLAKLFLGMFLLQAALYGLTLFASALGREAGRVALAGVLLAVVSFMANAIAALWDKAAFIRPWTLHGHFEPREILVQGTLAGDSVVVLVVVAVIGIAAAFARFHARDLP